jgi:sterol 3beta-glucosyltransferase
MKILVATIGSRGDVQPYVNLCQGLQTAGHDVTLATNPTLCPLATAHAVKSVPVGPPVDMGEVGERLLAESFNNMWLGMLRVMQVGARLVEQAFPDVLQACAGADLIVVSDSGSGIAEAEKLGRPWISVTLQPARISVPVPHPSWAERILGPVLGRLLVMPTNRFRQRVGAPPAQDISTLMSTRMILLPVSSYVAPPNPLWPPYVRPTGYWFARPLEGWAPPASLQEFLATGDKPVAISLGVMSLSGQQARQGAQIVLDAIGQAGVRAVVQGWDSLLEDLTLPATIYRAGSLPHSWLFDQVSAVVHHGGFGTTAATLRAGVPAIVVPHIIDQFYWGQRVFELGVGPKYIPRGQLKAQPLAAALRQSVSDAPLRAKAAELGRQIRAEPDGVTRAVQLIETAI